MLSPGLVIMSVDVELQVSFPLTTTRPYDVFEPDVTASLNFFFLGAVPFTVTSASPLMFVPFIVRVNFPAAARSQWALSITGWFAVPPPVPVPGRHRNVSWGYNFAGKEAL